MSDKSKITIKAEAYSCKLTQSDRKILRMLNEEYSTESESEESPEKQSKPASEQQNGSLTSSSSNSSLKDRANRKTHAYLVGTMNSAFPDYDFSAVSPESFILITNINAVIQNVNTTLFTAGVSGKNSTILAHFNNTLWNCINEAITLSECTIYTYQNNQCDFDVLSDGGCVWSFNYLFFNRKLKRTLLFVCRRTSQYDSFVSTPLLDDNCPYVITPTTSETQSQTEINSQDDQ